jgi:hypothetical protein
MPSKFSAVVMALWLAHTIVTVRFVTMPVVTALIFFYRRGDHCSLPRTWAPCSVTARADSGVVDENVESITFLADGVGEATHLCERRKNLRVRKLLSRGWRPEFP